jgi:putative endonuclease
MAEDHALAFLKRQGLALIERNYRCRCGEIDLVMEDRGTVVFVEVRFRKTARFGGALESVDRRKQSRLLAAAARFLRDRCPDRPARFDVAALSPSDGGFAVEWVKDAFRAG